MPSPMGLVGRIDMSGTTLQASITAVAAYPLGDHLATHLASDVWQAPDRFALRPMMSMAVGFAGSWSGSAAISRSLPHLVVAQTSPGRPRPRHGSRFDRTIRRHSLRRRPDCWVDWTTQRPSGRRDCGAPLSGPPRRSSLYAGGKVGVHPAAAGGLATGAAPTPTLPEASPTACGWPPVTAGREAPARRHSSHALHPPWCRPASRTAAESPRRCPQSVTLPVTP